MNTRDIVCLQDRKLGQPKDEVEVLKTQLATPTATTVVHNTPIYMPINKAYINVDLDRAGLQAPTKVLWHTQDDGGKTYEVLVSAMSIWRMMPRPLDAARRTTQASGPAGWKSCPTAAA